MVKYIPVSPNIAVFHTAQKIALLKSLIPNLSTEPDTNCGSLIPPLSYTGNAMYR